MTVTMDPLHIIYMDLGNKKSAKITGNSLKKYTG